MRKFVKRRKGIDDFQCSHRNRRHFFNQINDISLVGLPVTLRRVGIGVIHYAALVVLLDLISIHYPLERGLAIYDISLRFNRNVV